MFTQKESTFIRSNYFNLVRSTDNFIEFQSKSTKHCWIICKNSFTTGSGRPIIIYHKHSPKIEYYHKHWECYDDEVNLLSVDDTESNPLGLSVVS